VSVDQTALTKNKCPSI